MNFLFLSKAALHRVHSLVSRDGHLYTSPLLTIFSSNIYLYYTTSPAVRMTLWTLDIRAYYVNSPSTYYVPHYYTTYYTVLNRHKWE